MRWKIYHYYTDSLNESLAPERSRAYGFPTGPDAYLPLRTLGHHGGLPD